MNTRVRRAGYFLLGASVVLGVSALVLRDQLTRNRRDLFSPNPLRRLAALGHLGRGTATVGAVTLLRDFREWEENSLLRRRAGTVLARMEDGLRVREEER